MISLDNLSFAYRKGILAIKDATARFEPGIHLILGPNGAGKTTLLNLMAGLLCPLSGHCKIDGDESAAHEPHLLRRLFFLPEDCLMPFATINEMVKYHAPFYPTFSREVLDNNLRAFGLNGTERLDSLSLGARKKANIAYALALGTEVLLLDEPANGLDISSKKTLTRMLASQAGDNRHIFISTHSVWKMRNLFESVTILNHGRIVLNISVDTLNERLGFVVAAALDPRAIFSEKSLGGYRQIIPIDDPAEMSEVDFELLYSAMISDAADKINQSLQ